MNINATVGKMIRDARKRKNLTQEELANMVYVTKQAISNYELGNHRVDEDLRTPLGKILGITIDYEVYGIDFSFFSLNDCQNKMSLKVPDSTTD